MARLDRVYSEADWIFSNANGLDREGSGVRIQPVAPRGATCRCWACCSSELRLSPTLPVGTGAVAGPVRVLARCGGSLSQAAARMQGELTPSRICADAEPELALPKGWVSPVADPRCGPNCAELTPVSIMCIRTATGLTRSRICSATGLAPSRICAGTRRGSVPVATGASCRAAGFGAGQTRRGKRMHDDAHAADSPRRASNSRTGELGGKPETFIGAASSQRTHISAG